MDRNEQAAWSRHQMKNAGHWTVDPIHDGVSPCNGGKRDLIVHCGYPHSPTDGIYVMVGQDGTWQTGSYEGAVPHIGDAEFTPKQRGKEESFDQACAYLVERLGLKFLLALAFGRSPYRVL